MQLMDVVRRQIAVPPWEGGAKIPWNDPAFSKRMLNEHLSQEHDLASRRLPTIDKHVEWIHQTILSAKSSRILDLGCGPGLYTCRLARLGHECAGIDFSPASIAYARERAQADDLPCTYLEQDIRQADFGAGYDLVMMIFGELNSFKPEDARVILTRAFDALDRNGHLLIEASTFSAIRRKEGQPRVWYSSKGGLFSDRPHVCLIEHTWDAEWAVMTNRYFIVDGDSGQVTQHTECLQAYTAAQYQRLLSDCGFCDIAIYPSLPSGMGEPESEFIAIVAHKPA